MTTTGAVNAIGALADPIRRRLYNYVLQQRGAVSREEAAEALNLPLTKTKFHLERLTKEGLLDVEYRRMSGRQGPGAGRPSKLYRRAEAEISVSLPERRYDLMGDILAGAVVRNQHGESLQPAIVAVAHEKGTLAALRVDVSIQGNEDLSASPANATPATTSIGTNSTVTGTNLDANVKVHANASTNRNTNTGVDTNTKTSATTSTDASAETSRGHFSHADAVLTKLGYEPEQCTADRLGPAADHSATAHSNGAPRPGGGTTARAAGMCPVEELRLRNCPFDALAQEHRELVCGTNQHFVQGVLDGAGCGSLRADLEPHSGYCCVVVREEHGSGSDS